MSGGPTGISLIPLAVKDLFDRWASRPADRLRRPDDLLGSLPGAISSRTLEHGLQSAIAGTP
ncbi:MAG: hypothetical protein ACRDKU_05355 [Gaiellaceae bacterium]